MRVRTFHDPHEFKAHVTPLLLEREAENCVMLHGVRIGMVYTPPEFRGRGYASNYVATLTRRLLDSGRRFCFLFADLSNPTFNKIYQSVGYRHVCDFRKILFRPAANSSGKGRR